MPGQFGSPNFGGAVFRAAIQPLDCRVFSGFNKLWSIGEIRVATGAKVGSQARGLLSRLAG